MKNVRKKQNYAVVLITAPDLKVGRVIINKALESKLIACANIVPKIESHYWWEGKLEKSSEVLIIMKTRFDRIKELEKNVLSIHPYNTPEFIVLDIKAGFKGYLDWLDAVVNV